MGLVALDSIIVGSIVVERGDDVPESFVDLAGDEQPVDGDRLVDLGVAAPARSSAAKAARANADVEPEPEQPPAAEPEQTE